MKGAAILYSVNQFCISSKNMRYFLKYSLQNWESEYNIGREWRAMICYASLL